MEDSVKKANLILELFMFEVLNRAGQGSHKSTSNEDRQKTLHVLQYSAVLAQSAVAVLENPLSRACNKNLEILLEETQIARNHLLGHEAIPVYSSAMLDIEKRYG